MTQQKLVPCEPTEAMLTAFHDAVRRWMNEEGEHEDVYLAMLAAAPKASEDEALLERVAKAISGAPFPSKQSMVKARAVLKMLEGE